MAGVSSSSKGSQPVRRTAMRDGRRKNESGFLSRVHTHYTQQRYMYAVNTLVEGDSSIFTIYT